jgi:hypothetical protein
MHGTENQGIKAKKCKRILRYMVDRYPQRKSYMMEKKIDQERSERNSIEVESSMNPHTVYKRPNYWLGFWRNSFSLLLLRFASS